MAIQKGNKVYITGDTHGGQEGGFHKFTSKKFRYGKLLTKNDYIVVAGDFGLLWCPEVDKHPSRSLKQQRHELKTLTERPWTTLFIDGNHENHDLLEKLEEVPMFGDYVGKVNDSVFHLKRGRVYTIAGKKFFTLGGAESSDKEYRTVGINYWKQEIPSYKEMDLALENLERHNWEVDYVITHNGPEWINNMFMSHHNAQGLYNTKLRDPTANFLEHVRGKLNYKKWFYGHWHEDWSYDKFSMLYRKIEKIL